MRKSTHHRTRLLAARSRARDLLNAAREGYAYRSQGKRPGDPAQARRGSTSGYAARSLTLPRCTRWREIFHLAPGLSHYRIKSELTEEAKSRPASPLGDDTIYMNTRSILQIMTFLSKGVCIPEEHVRTGVAPSTPGPDGRPFNWTRVTAGNFFVHSQKHRPRDAEVAVHYRGYWFYIAPNDVDSRAVLAILEILFGLQESDGKSVGPVLTLPVGG